MSKKWPANMVAEPLQRWPQVLTPEGQRKRSPFRAGFNSTIDLLDTELWHLGAHPTQNAPSVVQLAITRGDFRVVDNMPRADARPEHPGVLVTAETIHGPQSWACDRFDAWQDNLRAIALGLQALRMIGRYGINSGTEQYRGFAQLDAATPMPAGMSERDALFVVARWSHNQVPEDQLARWVSMIADEPNGGQSAAFRSAWRRARAYAHPDSVFGSRKLYDSVLAAGEVLRAHGYEVRL